MATDPLPTPGDDGWRPAWRFVLETALPPDGVEAALDDLGDLATRAEFGDVLDNIDDYMARVVDDGKRDIDDIRREIERLRQRVGSD